MTTSDAINELAAALAKAQGEMAHALKLSENPTFNSRYASLAAVWDACRGPLAKHGLAIVQSPSADGARVSVETFLAHGSGQWMRDTLSVVAADASPQAVGSAASYCCRYALRAFAGVASADDDGERAQGRGNYSKTITSLEPAPTSDHDAWIATLKAVAPEGTKALHRAWYAGQAGQQKQLLTEAPDLWLDLQEIAAFHQEVA